MLKCVRCPACDGYCRLSRAERAALGFSLMHRVCPVCVDSGFVMFDPLCPASMFWHCPILSPDVRELLTGRVMQTVQQGACRAS